MKTNLAFQSPFWVLLMVVLIFSIPFTTFAQQKSVEVQAKMAAERDANTDVNVSLWLITGTSASCGGLICYGFATGIFNRSLLSPAVPVYELVSMAWSGAGVGCLIPLISSYAYQPGPPLDRFIGKSPEYIDLYTKFYKRRTRQLRIRSTVIGAAAPPVIYTVALLFVRE